MPTLLGRDDRGNVIEIDIAQYTSGGGPHNHAEYATDSDLDAHAETPHGGGAEHPDLTGHTNLGLAEQHDHDFAASVHSHDTSHSHDLTAYATDADLATHAATPHGGEGGEHPDLATHESLGLVTDSDLTTHAATAHGTQAHAISGVSHTGTLDHSALGSVTANQHHNESHKTRHATGGADALAASDIGAAASGHNHDAAYSASGHTHTLNDGDIPAAIARDAEVTSAIATHAATPHGGGEGGEAFPVGSIFMAVVSTNPATLLGYGTWSAWGAGKVIIGRDTGQSGGDLLGDATHAHAGHTDHAALTHAGAAVAAHNVTQPSAHTDVINHTHSTDSQGAHVHDEYRNSATTGGLDGWAAGDTSTNTPLITGYDTGSAGAHTHTAQNPAGGVASISHTGTAVDAHSVTQPSQHAAQSHSAHDAVANLPPAIVAYLWERTA